ncbi:hypothetical protein [Peptoniphilus lacrimalis]|nr:hypothetical protein [Peptoniphilus lacrimalis]
MDLVILEKIKSSILNGLGYIGRLEKKNGSSRKKIKNFVKSTVAEDKKL